MAKKTWVGRLYLGAENGKQQFEWLGRFPTKRERDKAVAEARLELERGGSRHLPTCDAYVERYLTEYQARAKDSSYITARERLKPFAKHFEGRSMDISRAEAKDWSETVRSGTVQAVVTLYNHAMVEDDIPLERNPFRKLGRRTKGRADEAPPTEAEFGRLLKACSVLGDYGAEMKAFFLFCTYTLMRPGEAFAVEWTDIDFERMRIHKARRVFRGSLDVPKTGEKIIALTPPARDAIIGLPRVDNLVFHTRTGKRLSQPALSLAWKEVTAAAGFHKPFYLCSKHFGVWMMWTQLKMQPHVIAAQAGWSVSTVQDMLKIYGHGEVGALDQVDEAFKNAAAPQLQVLQGGQSDAIVMPEPRKPNGDAR